MSRMEDRGCFLRSDFTDGFFFSLAVNILGKALLDIFGEIHKMDSHARVPAAFLGYLGLDGVDHFAHHIQSIFLSGQEYFYFDHGLGRERLARLNENAALGNILGVFLEELVIALEMNLDFSLDS